MIKKIQKSVKGITLIALVVTIIVLLILAGVAISLTIGNNGIFTRAQIAVVRNENASVYEQLQFVVADYQLDAIETGNNEKILNRLKTDGYVDEENVLNVDKLMGRSMQTGKGSMTDGDVYVIEQRAKTASEQTSETSTDMDYYLIYYDDENIDINLGLAFEKGELNWNTVFENAQKHPEQSTENETIGIDEDGNPVNMDWWYSKKTEDGLGYSLGDFNMSGYSPSYWGQIIDGKIEGKVPSYIKKPGDDKFYPVTELFRTFTGCTSLTEAPVIPDSVTNMIGTFSYCTGLMKAPVIPNKVTNMGSTFAGCTSLTEAPVIPDSVIYMTETFSRCTGLTKVPVIPDSVKSMSYAFYCCTSLTGTIEINANPDNYDQCFSGASTSDNANLVLTGSSTMLQELLETKSEHSHITIQE